MGARLALANSALGGRRVCVCVCVCVCVWGDLVGGVTRLGGDLVGVEGTRWGGNGTRSSRAMPGLQPPTREGGGGGVTRSSRAMPGLQPSTPVGGGGGGDRWRLGWDPVFTCRARVATVNPVGGGGRGGIRCVCVCVCGGGGVTRSLRPRGAGGPGREGDPMGGGGHGGVGG